MSDISISGTAVKLLTTTEAARRCGVCPRTVLRWLTLGELDGVRTPGGHWRVRESDLAAFESRSKAAAPVSTLRVVLVEDEPTEALALARLVELFAPGARIELAEDGLAAGLLLGATLPHVAFVDIQMPRLDGIDVIRRARGLAELSHTRFAVVSGHLTPERVGALNELGVVDVLRKPVDPGAVQRILAACSAEVAGPEVP